MSQTITELRTLTKDESAILLNLNWSEERTSWQKTKDGRSYPYHYQMISFDNAGLEAVNVLTDKNPAPKERFLDSGGVFLFSMGDSALFKSKKYVPKKRTPEQQSQLQADRAGLGGGESTSTKVDWDAVHKRQEERDKRFDEKHEESMTAMDNLIGVISQLDSHIVDLARIIVKQQENQVQRLYRCKRKNLHRFSLTSLMRQIAATETQRD